MDGHERSSVSLLPNARRRLYQWLKLPIYLQNILKDKDCCNLLVINQLIYIKSSTSIWVPASLIIYHATQYFSCAYDMFYVAIPVHFVQYSIIVYILSTKVARPGWIIFLSRCLIWGTTSVWKIISRPGSRQQLMVINLKIGWIPNIQCLQLNLKSPPFKTKKCLHLNVQRLR